MQYQETIQDYIQILLRRRWVVFTFFIVLVFTVLIGTLKQTPIYSASATILIDRQKPRVFSVQEVTKMGPTDVYNYKDYYGTQNALLKSRSFLQRISDLLKQGDNEFGVKADVSIRTLKKDLNIGTVKGTQLVSIAMQHSDPTVAAAVANLTSDEFIKYNLERSLNAVNYAGEWLAKKIDEQQDKLKKSEVVLQKYREDLNINVLPQDKTSGSYVTEELKEEYSKLQSQMAGYEKRYTEKHPKMVELRAEIKSLKNKIYGLEDAATSATTTQYRALEREVQTNKRFYENLLSRLKEIDISNGLDVNNISLVDRAIVPEKPIKPNVVLNLVLAVMAGVILGVGLAFFVDYLDTTVKSSRDIKSIGDMQLLGSIPEMKQKVEREKNMIVVTDPTSPVAEAYRTIRTEFFQIFPPVEESKAILVTSAEPKVGKTLTSSNLAAAIAKNGSTVLLVDADLRKPQVAKMYNHEGKKGLSEYLRKEIGFDDVVCATEVDGLSIVPSGKISSDPSEFISTDTMDKFIKEAKSKFDYVIFDTPPIINITDAVVLANKVDGVIQVVRSGRSKDALVLRCTEQLMRTKAKMVGTILNGLNAYNDDVYYYGYYKSYYEAGK